MERAERRWSELSLDPRRLSLRPALTPAAVPSRRHTAFGAELFALFDLLVDWDTGSGVRGFGVVGLYKQL